LENKWKGEFMENSQMRQLGSLLEAAKHTDLKNKSGVYRLRCAQCSLVLYVGQAKELLVRLIQHAFCPPYGAVDLVLGEVLNAAGRDRWSRLCDHLKRLSRQTRLEIARGLLVDVLVPEDPSDISAIESRLLAESAAVFGAGGRTWQSTHMDDFTDYWISRAGGGLPAKERAAAAGAV
jgi:hypothetical protein